MRLIGRSNLVLRRLIAKEKRSHEPFHDVRWFDLPYPRTNFDHR